MNALQHAQIGVTTVTLATVIEEYNEKGTITEETFIAFLIASTTSSMPDWIEPAFHPNHRQFFHSIAFALGIGAGVYKAYQWQPQNTLQLWARRGLIAIGITYLVHLLVDSTTPKGLPLI